MLPRKVDHPSRARVHYCQKLEVIRKVKFQVYREEIIRDLDNSKELPGDEYWGIATTRAMDNVQGED